MAGEGPSLRRGRRRALDDNDTRRSDDTSEHGRHSLLKQRHTDARQGAWPIVVYTVVVDLLNMTCNRQQSSHNAVTFPDLVNRHATDDSHCTTPLLFPLR